MRKGIEDLLTDEHFRQHILNPSIAEGDYWKNWLNEHEENADLYEQAKSLIIDFYEPLSKEEFQAEAIDFKRKIDVTNADKNDIISLYDQRKDNRNPWILRVAASLLIIVSIAFAAGWYFNKLKNQELVSYDPTKNFIKKETDKGHKSTITFRDGTRVKLNSESFISYPEEFSGKVREVTLSGEAYFDVAHYDEWPFIVKSKGVQTRVLGTSFNVSAYPEEYCVKVALVEGSVEVKVGQREPVKLMPQKMAKIGKEEKIEVLDFDIQKITAWKDNIIIFEKASFDEVQSTLERWYNVKFVYDQQPVFEGGYTGEFVDISLELVLKGMSANKFNYEITGNKVFIK